MKRLLCLFLITAFAADAYAQADSPAELKQLRQKMVLALNSGKTTDSLYNTLDKMPNKPPVYVAYLGILDGLKAKHSWNPYSKLKYLGAAEKVLKQAVDADPHNIEIRFLRFSIEHNAPGFLGYNKNLTADKDEMIRQLNAQNYGTANKPLTIQLIKFLIDSKQCSPAEIETLHKHLAAIS
ncbi:hypothetical protein BEL04_20485 [Mucilaginibacter sp. PPCGB 2223]|uniref:hypothetical protein n=1 Tax=Mucilaginibacter sp. PPCGB 2223 TaxID=1886027 RepID=UPI0008262F86|nr:hypothetical protein [Mucilaginibacter sp. PPCGB 2223]OCX51094.1 hypothetical protein BEL04_20485 [Mucilaginibacter sp. PPCGB 2223]